MKTSSFLKIALFAVAFSCPGKLLLVAQNPPPPPPAQFGGPDRAPRFHPPPNPLMEALDTNHDGVLSADEIASAAASLKKLDKNGDGQLTQDELRPPPPGGRGGPPRGQPGPGNPGANPGGFREESAARLPPGPPPSAGGDPATDAGAHAPAAAIRAQRPPPRLEDDPVAARLDKAVPAPSGQGSQPAGTPHSLFDLLDTNHDGTLSEEELRNAPALLRQLDLKSVTLPDAGPVQRGDRRPSPPAATP